jgi:hypothetical protein
MALLIQEIPCTDAPMALLLLADPSEDKVWSSGRVQMLCGFP